MSEPLAPPALVPARLVDPAFVAEPLTLANVALDHAAYVASPDVIRVHSDGRWPVDGFTLDDDRRLVTRHQADHGAGRAFAFLLRDPARSRASGCLYVNPLHPYLRDVGADAATTSLFPARSAMVTFWVRQDEQDSGLSLRVATRVHEWLVADWPLDLHVFRSLPGETATLAALASLPLRRLELDLPGEPRPYLWHVPRPAA